MYGTNVLLTVVEEYRNPFMPAFLLKNRMGKPKERIVLNKSKKTKANVLLSELMPSWDKPLTEDEFLNTLSLRNDDIGFGEVLGNIENFFTNEKLLLVFEDKDKNEKA